MDVTGWTDILESLVWRLRGGRDFRKKVKKLLE
jgi:hypothetical protein